MPREYVFPFSAIVGQDRVKKALILNAVNPGIGGVLISGEKGTAKSTMVRGLSKLLPGMEVVDLPLNITEDRLIGTIDLEKAISTGKKFFEPGILAKAHKNILYVDEVNLLSEHIVNSLLDVAQSGVNIVEREGISYAHKAQFVLVGTMNPEEGMLRPQFLDRFGLYVEVKGEGDIEERKRVISRRIEYERSPEEFIRQYQKEEAGLAQRICTARNVLELVEVTHDIIKIAADIAKQANCQGHRADLVLVETARAIAALEGRKNITIKDLKEAAELALPHRTRPQPPQNTEVPEETKEEESTREEQERQEEENRQEQEEEDGLPPQEETRQRDNAHNGNEPEEQSEPFPDKIEEKKKEAPFQEDRIDEPGEIFSVKPIQIQPFERKDREGSGKRSKTKTSSRQGRYIRYRIPSDKVTDLAFDATLRAAALFQKKREKNALAMAIEKSDLREKVREKRIGNTLLFVVDASGSMGANQRMRSTKAAILSLLNDAYQKRDMVGLVAFRKNWAEVMLGITRSVDLASKNLRELPTGGKTPLAAGLFLGYEILKARQVKDPDMVPVLILVSDCRANVALHGGDPVEEAKELGRILRYEGINALVIDTEKDFIELGLAKEIAEAMGAKYYKLNQLEAFEIEGVVRNYLGT